MKKSVAALCLSMTVFGTVGLFKRFIPVSAGELALYRAVLAAIVLGVFLLITKNPVPYRKIKKQLPLLLLTGAVMGFNWILLFKAYDYTTVSIATLSYSFAPVLVTAACPLLFRERLNFRQVLYFAVSTLGLVLITGIDTTGDSHLTGVLFGLAAAILYASVVLMNKHIQGVGGIHRTYLQFLAAIAVLVPYVLCTGGADFSQMDSTGFVCLLVLGIVHTGITYCLYFSSISKLPGQQVAILSYIDPLVAVLCSVFILHEPMSGLQRLGGGLILGATALSQLVGDNKV